METPMAKVNWQKVGVVGVDSGCMMLADPCYVVKGEDCEPYKAFGGGWPAFVEKSLPGDSGTSQLKYDAGCDGLGVVIGNFGGDGTFPVFVERGADGGIAKVMIDFEGESD
jgi:hypothetical protein